MWQLFNLIFLFVVAVVLYLPFAGVWTGLVFLFRVRRKLLACLVSVPVYVALLIGWVQWQNRPAAVFEGAFGFPPPADVQGLESSVWILGDSGSTYLHFRATPQTVQRIVGRGLAPGRSASVSGGTPPGWWKPPPAPPAVRYEGQFSNRGFASELEILVHDPSTGDVWFQFSGVD